MYGVSTNGTFTTKNYPVLQVRKPYIEFLGTMESYLATGHTTAACSNHMFIYKASTTFAIQQSVFPGCHHWPVLDMVYTPEN